MFTEVQKQVNRTLQISVYFLTNQHISKVNVYKLNIVLMMKTNCHRSRVKDTRGTIKLIDRKLTDNAMAKKEKDKQTNHSTQDTL